MTSRADDNEFIETIAFPHNKKPALSSAKQGRIKHCDYLQW